MASLEEIGEITSERRAHAFPTTNNAKILLPSHPIKQRTPSPNHEADWSGCALPSLVISPISEPRSHPSPFERLRSHTPLTLPFILSLTLPFALKRRASASRSLDLTPFPQGIKCLYTPPHPAFNGGGVASLEEIGEITSERRAHAFPTTNNAKILLPSHPIKQRTPSPNHEADWSGCALPSLVISPISEPRSHPSPFERLRSHTPLTLPLTFAFALKQQASASRSLDLPLPPRHQDTFSTPQQHKKSTVPNHESLEQCSKNKH